MKLLRHAGSVGFQVAGSGATFLTSVIVAAGFGLAAQGQYALLKSWIDALATIAALGLPQGLLHLIYRKGYAEASLWRWTRRYLAGLLAACLAVSACLLALGGGERTLQAAVVALILPAAVAHQLWRSLGLRRRGVLVFSAITAAPALLLLALVVVWLATSRTPAFGWMLLVAWWLSALCTGWVVRPVDGAVQPSPSGGRELWSVSLQAALQTAAAGLLPAALLSLANRFSGSIAAVGVLSLSMQVYQLFALAATYVAPMVYDAAAGRGADPAGWLRRVDWKLRWLPPLLAVLAPAGVALFWGGLRGHVVLTTILAVAGVMALYGRVFTTILQARGAYAELSMQSLARLAAACAACAMLDGLGVDAAESAGLALLMVEAATVWRLSTLMARPEPAAPAVDAQPGGAPLLVLVTTNHPFAYTGGESMFVGPELPALADAFPDMIVAPLHAVGDRVALPSSVRLDAGLSQTWRRRRWAWYARAVLWPGFIGEARTGWRRGGMVGLARTWRWTAQAAATWDWAAAALPRDRALMFYTYWRGGATVALCRYAQEAASTHGAPPVHVVTRTHGYDLYEERYRPPFQPWTSVYARLDRVVTISRHGFDYLRHRGVDDDRLALSRLGTARAAATGGPSVDGISRIASCGSVIPLKRVPLMARSVSELARRHPAHRFEWMHLGDGPEMPAVRAVSAAAPANLTARLPGAVAHDVVLGHLAAQPVDAFLLLSETEGLPVVVQEALAHSIPVLATDVGGVGEAVDAQVGWLLPADPDVDTVVRALESLLFEPAAARDARRAHALARWARDFDADANHRAFARLLRTLALAPARAHAAVFPEPGINR